MKCLITGGSGFVGSHLTVRLREAGQEVSVFDTRDDVLRPADVKLTLADIADRRALRAAMRGVQIVYHNVDSRPRCSRAELTRVIVRGSQTAAEEAALAGVRYFVHMSSSAVFGASTSNPITTETRPCPGEPYGMAKLQAEQAVEEVGRREGLKVLVVRSRPVLGQRRLGLFHLLFNWIREGRRVYVFSNGEHRTQFVHIDDLIDACLLAQSSERTGIIHVGAAEFGSWRESLLALIRHSGSRSTLCNVPERATVAALRALQKVRLSPIAPLHDLAPRHTSFFDVSPLVSLGWKPRYSNTQMLREAYDWYVAQDLYQVGSLSPRARPVHEGALRVVRWLS